MTKKKKAKLLSSMQVRYLKHVSIPKIYQFAVFYSAYFSHLKVCVLGEVLNRSVLSSLILFQSIFIV